MKSFFLFIFMGLTSAVYADDIQNFVRRECPSCQIDIHNQITLDNGNMTMKVFRVSRNTIQFSLFFVRDSNGLLRDEYNADSGNREAEAQRLCRVMGNFSPTLVTYRNVFNTRAPGGPAPSHETINMLTCRKGRGRLRTGEQPDNGFTYRVQVPPINLEVPIPEINVNSRSRFLEEVQQNYPVAPTSPSASEQ